MRISVVFLSQTFVTSSPGCRHQGDQTVEKILPVLRACASQFGRYLLQLFKDLPEAFGAAFKGLQQVLEKVMALDELTKHNPPCAACRSIPLPPLPKLTL